MTKSEGDRCTVTTHPLNTPPTLPETAPQRADRHRPPLCQTGSGSARGLEAVGAISITAVSILILSRFSEHGVEHLLEKFPVRMDSLRAKTKMKADSNSADLRCLDSEPSFTSGPAYVSTARVLRGSHPRALPSHISALVHHLLFIWQEWMEEEAHGLGRNHYDREHSVLWNVCKRPSNTVLGYNTTDNRHGDDGLLDT